MTRALLVVSTFAALTMGSMGAANAVDYGVGPGGEHGRANRRNSYNYSDNCRNQFIYWTDQFGEHAVPKRDCEEGY